MNGTILSKSARATLALGSLLLLVACQTGDRRPEMLRICDADGCSERHRSSSRPLYDPTVQAAAPEDPYPWRGESVQELRASAQGGDAVAAYKLGLVRLHGLGGSPADPRDAARWLQMAADAGLPWAQYRLAELYRDGKGVRRDPGRAIALTMDAAAQGHALAAYNLGISHLNGDGVMRDEREAARLLAVAAEQNVPEAKYNLALMYFRGQGGQVRLYEALQLMRSAAEAGSLQAQAAVGRLYLTGLDTMGQDLNEATTWLSIAAGRGDQESQRLLDEIERQRQEAIDYERELRLRRAETQTYWMRLMPSPWLSPRPFLRY